MDVLEVHREAVGQVQARRSPPEYQTVRLASGETQVQKDLPEFQRPADAREWFADRIALTSPALGKWVARLYEIALADGVPAVREAVAKAGRELSSWDQWCMFVVLTYWGKAVTTATPRTASEVLQAAADEWGRRRLATERPPEEGSW